MSELAAHLAACEQAQAEAEELRAGLIPRWECAVVPIDDLRAVLHEARQAAEHAALIAAAGEYAEARQAVDAAIGEPLAVWQSANEALWEATSKLGNAALAAALAADGSST